MIEDGRAWALETFGEDGVQIRELVPEIIRECHEKMANAQAEADMKHNGPYGYIWQRCLEQFSGQLGRLPTAERVNLPKSPYKLVAFNSVRLFPWRYARESGVDLATPLFAVSDTRSSLWGQSEREERLNIPFDHPELSAAEQAIVDKRKAYLASALQDRSRVVVVGYASNSSGLHSIDWGEARLTSDGHLQCEDTESLLSLRGGVLADANSGTTFNQGPIPRPQLGVAEAEAGR